MNLSHDKDVTLSEIESVASGRERVSLAKATKHLLDERRDQIETFVKENADEQIYGFNRGFGHNVILKVGAEGMANLQRNLIRSHACGVGEAAETAVVRAMMLLRARSLAKGHSGVRTVVVERLLDLLNAHITPVVPRFGSVSASGDLAPLSHVALALMGEGEVFTDRRRREPAAVALAQAGIAPLTLEMKEGLALNNGAQFSNALGIVGVEQVETLLRTAVIATALSAQVMLGADTPFRADLHRLRQHQGGETVARWVFELMKDSPMRNAHRSYDIDGELQDPYSLRCAAQILGPCWQLIERAKETFLIEANSVTDNPVILPAARGWSKKRANVYDGQFVDVVSGGHFHGMPLAVDLYGLLQAMGIMARLANMRCARYIDRARNKGLGGDMKWPGVTSNAKEQAHQAESSGLMIPEYVTAGLTNAIWAACMPSHLFSLSTSAGQEDHVSMASNVGLRVLDMTARLAEILAIELAFASQAAAIRHSMLRIPTQQVKDGWVELQPSDCKLNAVGEAVLADVRAHFPVVTEDRVFADDIDRLAKAILGKKITGTAEKAGFRFS